MKKYFITAIVLICMVYSGRAQDGATTSTEKKGRPDLPGTLQLDYGFSFVSGTDYFKTGGSTPLNVYYLHNLSDPSSKWSFHAGIGFGFDRLAMADSAETSFTYQLMNSVDSSYYLANRTFPTKKSLTISNYIDIPLELRFHTDPENPSRSFMVAVGAKVGWLYRGMSKVKYLENDEKKIIKDIQKFHMNRLRYATYLRVGTGDFNVFYSYQFSPLFKKDEGPGKLKMNVNTVGISFRLF